MAAFDYDLFVIGAGSGGVRAARIAAQYGAKVAVAEEHRVGGTCVIRGCVPKKLMVYASQFSEAFEDAAGYGWTVPEATFDWSKLIAAKDTEIDRLNAIYIRNLTASGAELFQSRAIVEGPHDVRICAEDRVVTARVILVATGGRPWLDMSLPGIEHVITSNEVFYLKEMPRRVVIAGGGYIAVEFAGIFNGLGADTTLVYRGGEILRGFDDEIRSCVRGEMEKRGVKFEFDAIFNRAGGGRRRDHRDPLQRQDARRPTRCSSPPAAARRPTISAWRARASSSTSIGAVKVNHESRSTRPVDLCDRRRDEPRQPHTGGDPRGPRVRRHGVRQPAGPCGSYG